MSLSGTDGVVSGALEPLPDMGRGGSSVNRVTRSSTEGHPPGCEFNAGVAMDGGNIESRRHRQRNRYTLLITAGGLSCLRLRAN